MPHNMDRSGFRAGEYVVYATAGKTSYTMRVRRGGRGWETYYHEPLARAAGGVFTYATERTLAALAARFV
jgi:hypothetical protein